MISLIAIGILLVIGVSFGVKWKKDFKKLGSMFWIWVGGVVLPCILLNALIYFCERNK